MNKQQSNSFLFRLIAIAMIGFIVLIIANKSMYLHTHKLANGTIVTHAHPYNKTDDSKPFKKHSHTNFEFYVLHNIDTFFYTTYLAFSILLVCKILEQKKYTYSLKKLDEYLYLKGRSPPIFV